MLDAMRPGPSPKSLARGLALVLLLAAPACGRSPVGGLLPVPGAAPGADGGRPGLPAGADGGSGAPGTDAGPVCLQVPDWTGIVSAHAPRTDVLFVLDNSGGMESFHDRLSDAAPAFVQALGNSDGHRLVVVSTDVSSGTELSGEKRSAFASEPPYVLTSLDDSDCRRTQLPVSCPRAPPIDADAPVAEQSGRLAQALQLGTCGDGGHESGSAAALRALQNARRGRCPRGSLRTDAERTVLVLISNEDDQPPVSRPVEADVAELLDLVPASRLRLAVVAGVVGDAASACRAGASRCGSLCDSPPPTGSGTTGCMRRGCPPGEYCSSDDRCLANAARYFEHCEWCAYYAMPDCCSVRAAPRYVDLVRAFEERVRREVPGLAAGCRPDGARRNVCVLESLCQSDLRPVLLRIARELVAEGDADRRFPLGAPVRDPDRAVLRIAGRRVPPGQFAFEDGGRTLVIDPSVALSVGDGLELFCVD